MFSRGSRYEFVKQIEIAESGKIVRRLTRAREVKTVTGILEHTLVESDRLDLLALHYYNDSQKWWRILDANPQLVYAGDLTLEAYRGETILIARDLQPGSRG